MQNHGKGVGAGRFIGKETVDFAIIRGKGGLVYTN